MKKRYIIWCMLMLQIICCSNIQINMNIAIVSMVDDSDGEKNATSHNATAAICPNSTIFLRNFFTDTPQSSSHSKSNGFAWSKTEQNTILSGYYWLAYVSNLVGGILTQKFGPKRVIGLAQLSSSILSSFIPMFGHYGPVTVAWIRAMQGFLSSMTYPSAISAMIGNWSAPEERGRFELTAFIGFSIGFSVAESCFGYISQYIHWQYVFHVTCAYGVIVAILWFFLVHDSPASHPTISFEEKKYIQESLGKSNVANRVTIPWRKIVTNKAAILCALAHMAGAWLYFMPALYLPLYFKNMYGFNANEIGILTSLWRILASTTGVIVGYLTDMAIKRKLSTITRTRKCCCFIGCTLASVPLIVIAYFQCNVNLVIFCATVYSVLQVCSTFGPVLAMVDLSPEYCGILVGIAAFLGNIQLFLFSLLINYLTGIWETEKLWKNVFSFTTLYVATLDITFLIFGTCEVQNLNVQEVDKSNDKNSLECGARIDPILKSE